MSARTYNCKDEEIPVIGNYLLFSLKGDLTDFSAYLPKIFTDGYTVNLERKIAVVNSLLNPQSVTVELKDTASRLYSLMYSLIEAVNKVADYIRFAKGAIPVSVKDSGLTVLKVKDYTFNELKKAQDTNEV
jgi:hypothetical protein